MSAIRHHNALRPGYRLHWYRIESVLGQGGFGITYLATDTNLDQPVAVKEFLPSDLAIRTQDSAVHPVSDARRDTFGWGLTRFLTEARTLAQFRHPNIVRVYSVFEANGTAYMVMEYERGTSLEDALKFRYIEGEQALVSLVHALMDGLELVHEAGFIHRDIKPDNIFMRSNDGVPVLLDFGSARQAVGVETKTLTSLVTPGYAPFEQYNATRENDRQGPWTDVYSLAATLYRGITGAGPIDAVARADALLSGNPDPLIPLSSLEPTGYSPRLLEAVDAGLCFQPTDRPQTLAEWRSLLPSRPTRPDFTAAVQTMRAGSQVDPDEATVVRGDPPSRRGSTAPRAEPATAARAPSPADSAFARPERPASRASAAPGAAHDPPPAQRRRGRGALLIVGAVALLLVVAAAGGWFLFRPGEPTGVASRTVAPPATELPAADVVDRSRASAPADPAAVPATAESASGVGPLAAERQRLEKERQALAAERARFKLEAEQRAMREARRAAEREAAQIAEDRERLAEERRALEALRASEQERLVAQTVREDEARSRSEARALEQAAVTPATAGPAAPGAPAAPRATPQAPSQASAEESPQVTRQATSRAAASPAQQVRDPRVDELLQAADADLAALRLTSPPGRNAFERYSAVLEIEPGNPGARAGLERIVARYLALAEDAAARGDFARGELMLARAAKVAPQSLDVETAQARMARSRREAQAREAEAARERAQREQAREEEQRRASERLAQEAARDAEAARAREATAAAARVSAEAQADELRSVKVAVFPHDSIRTCFYSVGPRLHEAAGQAASASGKVDLVYSFYVRNADTSVVGTGGALWQGTAARKSPRVPAVQVAARSLGADAVLMAWYDCHSVQGVDEFRYRADVYLVDVRTGKVYFASRGLLETNKATAEVLRSLYAARGL